MRLKALFHFIKRQIDNYARVHDIIDAD